LNFVRVIAALATVSPLFAQYGGPAILARGQSPGPMSVSQIDFRPFVSVEGTYDTGLNGVSVDANGAPVSDASFGVILSFGVSGMHSWKHTKIGVNYSGGYTLYGKSFYSGVNSEGLQLSLTHQLSRHAVFSLNNNAVMYGSNTASPTLPPTVEFDPATTYVPTNDFFDNRTFSLSTQASLTIQKSTRTSYSVGLDAFLTRRWSSALYGSKGVGAHGDVMYRLSRRSTIGGIFQYMHYSFTGIYGSTDMYTVAASYSRSFSRTVEMSATGGITQYENVFVETVPIDPAIAAVIGVSSAQRVTYVKNLMPNLSFRLSKVVPRGTVFVYASNGLNPGNGLFLTSTSTTAGVGYNYTGLRRWALSAGANYNTSTSYGNVYGQYGSYSANLSASRRVAPMTHGVVSFNLRKYDSGDFQNYNKWSYGLSLGLSFSPGDIPVRLW
jgi:hypothetical protein